LKLSITSEMAAAQNRTAIKLRELMKPDLEKDCFFIFRFVLMLFSPQH